MATQLNTPRSSLKSSPFARSRSCTPLRPPRVLTFTSPVRVTPPRMGPQLPRQVSLPRTVTESSPVRRSPCHRKSSLLAAARVSPLCRRASLLLGNGGQQPVARRMTLDPQMTRKRSADSALEAPPAVKRLSLLPRSSAVLSKRPVSRNTPVSRRPARAYGSRLPVATAAAAPGRTTPADHLKSTLVTRSQSAKPSSHPSSITRRSQPTAQTSTRPVSCSQYTFNTPPTVVPGTHKSPVSISQPQHSFTFSSPKRVTLNTPPAAAVTFSAPPPAQESPALPSSDDIPAVFSTLPRTRLSFCHALNQSVSGTPQRRRRLPGGRPRKHKRATLATPTVSEVRTALGKRAKIAPDSSTDNNTKDFFRRCIARDFLPSSFSRASPALETVPEAASETSPEKAPSPSAEGCSPLVREGGTVAEAGSPTCTHLVVCDRVVKSIPFDVHQRLQTVKGEWFWASIQMEACADESMYRFQEVQETPTVNSKKSNTTPKSLDSGSRSRKMKKKELLAQLAAEGEPDSPVYGTSRKSNEVVRMSFSASFLDATADTSGTPADIAEKREALVSPQPISGKLTARQQTVMELLQTEKNYVGILNTLTHTFRDEIECPDQPGGPILSSEEIKLIFGKIPPILETHTKLRDDLQELVSNWREDRSIGAIVARHVEGLTRAYPPFVNYFEQSKMAIEHCDKIKPRFHAFLKVCQSRPECGRQTLPELLIRPVQRLPSVMLLLKDILKRTDRQNPDHPALEQAICSLETVMTHVNEDKRKTEGHQVMFDIVNDIDNVPPNLLSSHRAFVGRTDVAEVSDTLAGKGEQLSLFLFSDSLELCKRRVKVLNAKSPAAHGPTTPKKAYKHLEMLPLSCIKKVLDIVETGDNKNVFGFIIKKIDESEKLYAFTLADDDADKDAFLQTFCRHIANTSCRTDYENLLTTIDAHYLKLDVSDLQKNQTRAFSRFGKRVSRAFSFNKTPRKLKRAMSSMTQMMSPFRRDSFAGPPPHPLTPHRNDLRAMRLASTNDLTEDVPAEPFSDTYYSDLLDSVSVTSQSSINLRDAVTRLEDRKRPLEPHEPMGPPPLPDRRLTLTPGASLPFSPPGGRPSRRETLAGIPSFSTLVNNIRPNKKLRSMNSPCTPKTNSSSSRLPQVQENESPIHTTPSTPNLSSHLSKAATIGHCAGMKLDHRAWHFH